MTHIKIYISDETLRQFDSTHHNFEGLLSYAYFWSSTEKDTGNAYYRYLYYDLPDFPFGFTQKNGAGFSVRCVKKK